MDHASQRPLTILLVASDSEFSDQLVGLLMGMRRPDVLLHVVHELTEALERLSAGGIDLVLLELDLPDSQGLVTFERTFAFSPSVPILVLTETDDDEVALSAVQGGAQDCLIRHELSSPMLGRAIRYGMERHRLLAALRSLSLIDDLTGLYNRRGFSDLGEQYLKLSRRTGKGATLLFLDVDRFKEINDTLGHHVGDRALNRVADILRSAFRQSDIVARMGGDEFAVLAPEGVGEDQRELVERVRQALKEFNETSRDPFQLSVSVGITRADGETRIRLDDLLADADRAMYEEKRSKRKVVSQ